MDRLDLSLDDLAKESRKKNQDERQKNAKKAAPKKERPVKANNEERRGAKAKPAKQVRLTQPTAQAFTRTVQTQGRSDMQSRLGPKVASGTAVIFSNMNFNITQTDIRELCATIGPIGPRIFMKNNSGSADVMFDQKYDAIQAVKRFNNLTLDGRPMKVVLKESQSNQGQAGAPALNQSRNAGRMGGRELFGTRTTRNTAPATFSVNMGGLPKQAKKVQKEKQVKEVKVKVVREKKEKVVREKATPADPAQLDADMDSYFAARAKKE